MCELPQWIVTDLRPAQDLWERRQRAGEVRLPGDRFMMMLK
jgi:hypothetical protein